MTETDFLSRQCSLEIAFAKIYSSKVRSIQLSIAVLSGRALSMQTSESGRRPINRKRKVRRRDCVIRH